MRKIKRFFTKGQLLDRQVLIQFMRDNLGDLTFQVYIDLLHVRNFNVISKRMIEQAAC
mgnify:FL=1